MVTYEQRGFWSCPPDWAVIQGPREFNSGYGILLAISLGLPGVLSVPTDVPALVIENSPRPLLVVVPLILSQVAVTYI